MKITETYCRVEAGLGKGFSREEIFRSLGGTDDVARVVAATPHLDDRENFKMLNWVLVGIIFYFAVLKLLTSVFLLVHLGIPIYLYPFAILIPACAVALALQIRKFRGVFYSVTGFSGLAVLCNGVDYFLKAGKHSLVFVAVLYLPVLLGSILSFYLKKELCPTLGFLGAKTDAGGRYLFQHEAARQPDAPEERSRVSQ